MSTFNKKIKVRYKNEFLQQKNQQLVAYGNTSLQRRKKEKKKQTNKSSLLGCIVCVCVCLSCNN